MRKARFPQSGDMAYLIHKAIIVKDVLAEFHLAKVCYIHSNNAFYVDITALTKEPNLGISSLGINLFMEVQ